MAFEPDRVVFTHGQWFNRDATSQLRRSLSWLLGPDTEERLSQPRHSPAAAPRTSKMLLGAALVGAIVLLVRGWRRKR